MKINKSLKFKLLVFDLDGTIVDSAQDIHNSILKVFAKYHLQPCSFEDTKASIGDGLKPIVEKFISPQLKKGPAHLAKLNEEDLLVDFRSFYANDFVATSRLYEGVYDLLRREEFKVALLTNKSKQFAIPMLKALGIDQIPWVDIICGDTLSSKKPDPTGIRQIMQKAQCQEHECLMIGDGNPDILVAKNAGVKSLAISFGYTKIEKLMELGASARLNSYQEFDSVLASL